MIKYSEFSSNDESNLKYLLSLDKKDFKEFIRTLDEDEKEYALELMLAYDTELTLRKLNEIDSVKDVSVAAGLLRGYMLN